MQSLFWLKFSNFVAYTVMTPKSDGKTLYKRAKKSHNLFGWLFVFWIHSKLKVSYDIASINLHFRPFLCFIRVSCTSKTNYFKSFWKIPVISLLLAGNGLRRSFYGKLSFSANLNSRKILVQKLWP